MSSSAGASVATDTMPSRDSHDVRHCENARQARSGLPRWPTEQSSPATALTTPSANAQNSVRGDVPINTATPLHASSP